MTGMQSDRLLIAPADEDMPVPAQSRASRLNADPAESAAGLAKLVLTLVELIRQLLEREAIRRVERGTLTDAEIERMGTAFLLLQEKVAELRQIFGLSAEDLNIDLGPLGRVL